MSVCTKCPEDLKEICIEHYSNDGSPNCASLEVAAHSTSDNSAILQLLDDIQTYFALDSSEKGLSFYDRSKRLYVVLVQQHHISMNAIVLCKDGIAEARKRKLVWFERIFERILDILKIFDL